MSADAPRAIRIAILAMGGEGGGVLGDWIIDLAEHAGYIAQLTSVPGVAQRTGATIYYLELFPRAAALASGREPVLALMPVPGDVDVVVASELMEAARAVQRGLVTPDRTTLVASTHRVFAINEKVALADGRSDAPALIEACRAAARRFVGGDMAAAAERTTSVISAVLFGALARSGALPFGREAFEATIERAGVGVATSRRGFAAGFEAAAEQPQGPAPTTSSFETPLTQGGRDAPQAGSATGHPVASAQPPVTGVPGELAALKARAEAVLPEAARIIVGIGIERLADYQDIDYAQLYLRRLAAIAEADRRHGEGSFALTVETARQLALAMAYEDTIRVAELKTRAARFARVREEVGLRDGQILQIAEFLHPRLEEIAGSVPAPLGRFILRNRFVRNAVERLTAKGRIVKTTSIRGFLQLYAVAGLKRWRRSTLRHAEEDRHIEDWLARLQATAALDYALAIELAECRNLVKGYGDTHERGRASFDTIAGLVEHVAARPEPARLLAELRNAALADDTGQKLRESIGRLQLN